MRWIKIGGVVLLSVLATVLFALVSQRVAVDGDAVWAMDPGGSLYLLSEDGTLRKASAQGRLVWEVGLPQENEDGNSLRYRDMICDDSGSLYLVAQEYERQVDAAGTVQEIILAEEIQTWNGDGVQQENVLRVDKTTLSQYSTENYIRKLQMQGEILLALCCDQGRFDVIRTEPYRAGEPEVIASYDLDDGAETMEDCAALSDGTLVYSTRGGGLYALSPDGTARDLGALAGRRTMAGQLSADETDLIYFMDRSSGVLYELDLNAYTVTRLYSPDSVIDEASGCEVPGPWAPGTFAECPQIRRTPCGCASGRTRRWSPPSTRDGAGLKLPRPPWCSWLR